MPGANGRRMRLKKDGEILAGIQSKTVTRNNEEVNVTADDDGGFRTLLDDPGTRSIDISFEGTTRDNVLRELVMTGTSAMLEDITVEYENGDELECDFFIANLEETGAHDEDIEFSGELHSSGEWTFTPSTPE